MLASAGIDVGDYDEQSRRGADSQLPDTVPKADDGPSNNKQPEIEDSQGDSTCPEKSRQLPVEPINNQDGTEEDAEALTSLTLFSLRSSSGTRVTTENSVTKEDNQPETDDTNKET